MRVVTDKDFLGYPCGKRLVLSEREMETLAAASGIAAEVRARCREAFGDNFELDDVDTELAHAEHACRQMVEWASIALYDGPAFR